MGLDYSYTQPSSSEEYDMGYLLQAEAELYADEAESSYKAEPVQYESQPEADEGIPTTCYCGGEPKVATAYTRRDPGRRYFTCANIDDGECHIWKWWDVAVMEELSDIQKQLRQLEKTVSDKSDSTQKLLKLEKSVCELFEKTRDTKGDGVRAGLRVKTVCLMVCVVIGMLVMFLLGRASNGTKSHHYGLASVCKKSETEPSLITMETPRGYVNLLNSQTPVDLESPEPAWFTTQTHVDLESPSPSPEPATAKERRKWSPKEDKILIGAWLNTSKDPVVSNEQKAGAFWKRIQDYYNASPLLVGTTPRELVQCKQRWARINEQVCKFVGCFDAALREQRSGQNDDDVMKAALDIFYNDYSVRFSLEHAWRELRHDKKWCSTFHSKDSVKEKRKQVLEVDGEDVVGETEARPPGVKAAKAAIKRKKSGKEEELSKLHGIFEIKQKLSNQKLLERLLGKKEPLTEMETSLKLKLMSEML